MSSLQRFQVSVLSYKSRKTPRLEKQQQLLRGGDCLNPPVHLPTSYAGRPWNAHQGGRLSVMQLSLSHPCSCKLTISLLRYEIPKNSASARGLCWRWHFGLSWVRRHLLTPPQGQPNATTVQACKEYERSQSSLGYTPNNFCLFINQYTQPILTTIIAELFLLHIIVVADFFASVNTDIKLFPKKLN